MGIKAEQVMTSINEYPVVYENDSIEKAAGILIEQYKIKDFSWQGYESLLVLNDINKKVGFLTLRCVLKALEINDSDNMNHNSWHTLTDKIKISSELCVKELMRPLHTDYVKSQDDVDEAIKIIMKTGTNSVFVYDKLDIVGIIRSIDILWFLEDLL
ncbi:CBS domain-containing protein [Desulfofarcimen acetoxidans DSM 771]|uniref:CBS domain-containing protein n=1 Tax=Desulfofarcimen acetoxidans (strain ATCC 49208 / DSM 771 / KCTC 5769 / VKM B-1644 / 5575) TaxID=485916 RepID=C8W387_DESAS|nr:CBS domain-containing protein [Desulfofarcimen acetoxidans]ACV61854.1 CBS domain-containing protein [Desulfofarcimen acetoxidans DSM 771]